MAVIMLAAMITKLSRVLMCGIDIRLGWWLTFDVRGRRSGEAAKGTHKRSLWAVPLDGMVRPRHRAPPLLLHLTDLHLQPSFGAQDMRAGHH